MPTSHSAPGLACKLSINAVPVMDPESEGEVLAVLERNEIGRAYDRRLRALKTGELTAGAIGKRS